MKEFIELKEELTKLAKEKKACSDQYRRALNANNSPELLKVIYDNLSWCHDNKVITYEWLLNFPIEDLLKSGLANTGEDNKGYSNAGNRNAGNYNAGNRNTGNYNAGNSNAGNDNAGNYNAGNYNAGNRNAGNSNAGNDNAGNRNAGNDNAGNRNAGNRNAGNDNAGNDNAGNDNAGNYNAGNRNAGYSNAGNDNAGAFNTLTDFKLFNKKCKKTTFESFRESLAFRLLHSIDTTMWVGSDYMSGKEKADHPYHVTTLGYIKNIPYKEAFLNAWGNWNSDNRKAFTDMENFNADVFFEITSVRV